MKMRHTNPLNAELEQRLQQKYAAAARTAAQPQVDEHLIDDFMMYIDNDSELHEILWETYYKNLLQKISRGVYDSEQAPKLFKYFIKMYAAPKYVQEFFPGNEWFEAFPPRLREEIARRMRDHFEAAYEAGDLRHLVG